VALILTDAEEGSFLSARNEAEDLGKQFGGRFLCVCNLGEKSAEIGKIGPAITQVRPDAVKLSGLSCWKRSLAWSGVWGLSWRASSLRHQVSSSERMRCSEAVSMALVMIFNGSDRGQ
jgi:hypothetical protein